MTNTMQELQASLPMLKMYDWKNEELIEVYVKPKSFIRDNMLFISMEEYDNAGDYYGRYINESEQDGIPFINDALEAWASANNGYFEWQDAGSVVFNN